MTLIFNHRSHWKFDKLTNTFFTSTHCKKNMRIISKYNSYVSQFRHHFYTITIMSRDNKKEAKYFFLIPEPHPTRNYLTTHFSLCLQVVPSSFHACTMFVHLNWKFDQSQPKNMTNNT